MSSTVEFKPMPPSELFKWKHFQPKIILLTVRWYWCHSSKRPKNNAKALQPETFEGLEIEFFATQ
jgi:hypothetical protein